MNEILKAEAQLQQAMLSGDLTALDKLLADQLQFVLQNGVVATKAMDLETHRLQKLKLHSLEFINREIQILNETSSVTALAKLAGTYEGQEFQGTFRYLRVWVLTDGGWQVMAGSVSNT